MIAKKSKRIPVYFCADDEHIYFTHKDFMEDENDKSYGFAPCEDCVFLGYL